jgi:hypothetical protein
MRVTEVTGTVSLLCVIVAHGVVIMNVNDITMAHAVVDMDTAIIKIVVMKIVGMKVMAVDMGMDAGRGRR